MVRSLYWSQSDSFTPTSQPASCKTKQGFQGPTTEKSALPIINKIICEISVVVLHQDVTLHVSCCADTVGKLIEG